MNIGVVGNITKPSLPKAIEHLFKIGKRYKLNFFLHPEMQSVLKKKITTHIHAKQCHISSDLSSECDIIVAFGGDGTILSAARMVGKTQIPILGVNLGKLGFLAEVSLDELEAFINDVVKKRHVIEERTLIVAAVGNEKKEMVALNEVVIDKSSSSRVIHITVHVDGEYLVSFQGDGIIVSTPTGSTGYALAAGGPIVTPSSNVFVIQPISPHSLSARTVIVPDVSTIHIEVERLTEHARVTADGQDEQLFVPPTRVTMRKADHTVRLIKRKDRSYYDVLRAKLLWGRDIRLRK